MATVTLTFGDRAENHKGMQVLGTSAADGFSLEDLRSAKAYFEKKGVTCEIHHLNKLLSGNAAEDAENAYLFVARKGVKALVDEPSKLKEEQKALKKDTKAFMYGRVVNKKARHNLCFAEEGQEANFDAGKGTVVAFKEVPVLSALREKLPEALGDKAKKLLCEGNYYYDVKQCFIGYHGDGERKRVVGVRLGSSFPLHYQWYLESNAVGARLELMLDDGDLYVMSEKSVGTDWKLKKVHTLRHAAGFASTLKLGPITQRKETLMGTSTEAKEGGKMEDQEVRGVKRSVEISEEERKQRPDKKFKAE